MVNFVQRLFQSEFQGSIIEANQTLYSDPIILRSSTRIFYAFYIFTIKFLKSSARNFLTLQSGGMLYACMILARLGRFV